MIDTKELSQSIRTMTRHTKLYRVLKTELTVLGYWCNRARGKNIGEILAEGNALTRVNSI